LFASSCSDAQVVVQTWVDPCTNTAQTATFPINGPGVMGIPLEIHEFVYNSFMVITLGSFGLAGLENHKTICIEHQHQIEHDT